MMSYFLLALFSFTFFSNIDNSNQPYALYLPANFDAARRYPLILCLHSAESSYPLDLRRIVDLTKPQYIVAAPLARGDLGFQGIAENDVYDLLADLERRYPIDDDRIYLTGIGMGGFGALWLAVTRPDMWAAVAPLTPLASEDVQALTGNALNLPIHLYQGSADPLIHPAMSRRWYHDLLEAGAPVEYTEIPNLRHDIWNGVYRDGKLLDWFAQFKRNRVPTHVHFTSLSYRYNSAYWVRLDGLTPGVDAMIDARLASLDEVSVMTRNLDAFTLNLPGRPRVTIDGAKVAPAQSYVKTRDGWHPGLYRPVGKRRGLEGPIREAVAGPQIYVYGTDTREEAVEASQWSPGLTSFRVIAAGDLTATDRKSSNLILFGTRATNPEIARLDLPITLNVSAADYGLVFIYPAGDHYALINSGLPWWTGAEFDRSSPTFIPEKLRVLRTFPDYVLFKGSVENIVAGGRFQRDWSLAPIDAAKLRATGAVQIKP